MSADPGRGSVNQFRVYLRAELGKLVDRAVAEDFIAAAGPSGLPDRIGLAPDPDSLSHQLDSQAAMNRFVRSLSSELLDGLAKCCSAWRKNPNLYTQLTSSNEWVLEDVEIESINLEQAEPCLAWLFAELGYSLTAIATDRRVLSSRPYCDSAPGDPVDYPICLAKRYSSTYVVFDGIHRAIQLVRNGQRRIPLCFSDAATTAEPERPLQGPP